MQRFFFPSIVLSQAGRLIEEIQMIKYTKIAIFFEGALSDSKKLFWAHYTNSGGFSEERLRSCWLGCEGVLVETKGIPPNEPMKRQNIAE